MHTLRLGIESSTTDFAVALTSGHQTLATVSVDVRDSIGLDLRGLVQQALDRSGHRLADIGLVVVDVGPGNLSAVRSGVAFANALATSAGIPLVGANGFELMVRSSTEHRGQDWVCTRKASAGLLYAGLVRGQRLHRLAHGRPAELVQRLDLGPSAVFAGLGSESLLPHCPSVQALHSDVTHPTLVGLLHFLHDSASGDQASADLVHPITEQSALVHG